MSENLTILKSFARKLANCRFKVPADDLIEYFKGGQYGYDVVDGEEIVVTNESVFADSVATVIAYIRSAFKDPHIFLKKEEIIQNVAVASHIDNETLRMNYKDSKLWKDHSYIMEEAFSQMNRTEARSMSKFGLFRGQYSAEEYKKLSDIMEKALKLSEHIIDNN